MTVSDVLQEGLNLLTVAKIPSARLDNELLLAHVLGKDRSWLLAHNQDNIHKNYTVAFLSLIKQRADHTPLVHLTNSREFFGLNLYINDAVLTPRVETEKMVEFAIKYAPQGSKLIDVGTGSGAIAIAIAKHRPDLAIFATEVSPDALAVATKNAELHQVSLNLRQGDLFNDTKQQFDVVVCNLPYLQDDAELMPEVQKEPGVALFGGEDGLDIYRRFLAELPTHLNPGGYLFTECDPWQQKSLIAEAMRAGLKLIEEDYFILGFQRV